MEEGLLDSTRTVTTQDVNVDIETPVTVNPLLENDTIEQQKPLSHQTTTGATTAEQKPIKATVDYINNIKIFLTNIVIIFHCYSSEKGFTIQDMVPSTSYGSWGNLILLQFEDLCESYFMKLFFFCK